MDVFKKGWKEAYTMALNIGSFTSGYNAYNIPSVKDNPQVAPQPEQIVITVS